MCQVRGTPKKTHLQDVLNAISNSFQWPAFEATVAQLVPKKKLGHANGILEVCQANFHVFMKRWAMDCYS